MSLIAKILLSIGSLATIGFGVWHFFVPKIWNWYAYIAPEATELVLAIRAINIFFSLSLCLFGLGNLLVMTWASSETFSFLVMLGMTLILWGSRIGLQLFYPQGSMDPRIQYGMLISFVLIFFCFLVPFVQAFQQFLQIQSPFAHPN